MSARELRRVELLSRVKGGELKLVEAAACEGASYRQAKRWWKRYRAEGAEGLKHRSAGRRSNRAQGKEFRAAVMERVKEKYGGDESKRFGPTLAAEHLEKEDGLKVDAETLRRWMLAEGLWSRQRKRSAYRQRRERKEHFGEVVQMDGSFHAWLEERGAKSCLMNMVDDATGTTKARLGEQETTWAAARLLREWIEMYGIPRVLYTDRKNVYVREATEEEVRSGRAAQTGLGKMCAKLGIRISAAHSPQAKGRVERNHGVHQDRLIKKMRLKNITCFEAANRYLIDEYLPEHNQNYARPAASATDFHAAAPAGADLERVFCLEEERTMGCDWVVRYQNRLYQVQRQGEHYAPAQSKVTVCAWEDGRLEIHYRGQQLKWKDIGERPVREPVECARAGETQRGKWQPAADHPWRQYADRPAEKGIGAGRPASWVSPGASP